jgi:hypothetical protein
MWNAFREQLRDLGYLEGQNIAFEYRHADGVPERLAEAATNLARRSGTLRVSRRKQRPQRFPS